MIHDRMKELRLARGYTQEQVAEGMYMHQTTYCRLENGDRKPTAEELQRFCTFMGISVQELLAGSSKAAIPVGSGPHVHGNTPGGATSMDEQYYRDMLERKDRLLEESHSLLRSMMEMMKDALDQLRKRAKGGGISH
jgi:transcriptional regulator with XRE-family HTH domain